MRARHLTILALGLAALSSTAQAEEQRPLAADWYVCDQTAREIEAERGTPDHLLSAITLTESGRRAPDRTVKAWPWTINVGGQGYQYATKEQAIQAARQLLEAGTRSFDVGCMQINMRYHPRAFTSLEEAFEPRANITYAADFLERLANRHNDWARATGLYHSYTEEYNLLYTDRVETFMGIARRRASIELDPVELYEGPSTYRVMNADLLSPAGPQFDGLDLVDPQPRGAPPVPGRLSLDTPFILLEPTPILAFMQEGDPDLTPMPADLPREEAVMRRILPPEIDS